MAGSEVRTTYVEYDKTGKLAVTCGEGTGMQAGHHLRKTVQQVQGRSMVLLRSTGCVHTTACVACSHCM